MEASTPRKLSTQIASANFDAVGYINALEIDLDRNFADVYVKMTNTFNQAEKDLSKQVINSFDKLDSTNESLNEASQEIEEVTKNMWAIKSFSLYEEERVFGVSEAMRSLGQAKENLELIIQLITQLDRLNELVTSLSPLIKGKKVIELLDVMQHLNPLIKQFREYSDVEHIGNTLHVYDEETVNIMNESKTILSAYEENTMNKKQIITTMQVIEETDNVKEFVKWVSGHLINGYNNAFPISGPSAGIDGVEKRYTWFKQKYEEFEKKFEGVFPEQWEVKTSFILEFVDATKIAFDLLLKNKDQASPNFLNVVSRALQATVVFERFVVQKVFGEQCEQLQQTIEFKEKTNPFEGGEKTTAPIRKELNEKTSNPFDEKKMNALLPESHIKKLNNKVNDKKPNPFGDDSDDVKENTKTPPKTKEKVQKKPNPFGEDTDDDESEESNIKKSDMKQTKKPNPFGEDSDDDNEKSDGKKNTQTVQTKKPNPFGEDSDEEEQQKEKQNIQGKKPNPFGEDSDDDVKGEPFVTKSITKNDTKILKKPNPFGEDSDEEDNKQLTTQIVNQKQQKKVNPFGEDSDDDSEDTKKRPIVKQSPKSVGKKPNPFGDSSSDESEETKVNPSPISLPAKMVDPKQKKENPFGDSSSDSEASKSSTKEEKKKPTFTESIKNAIINTITFSKDKEDTTKVEPLEEDQEEEYSEDTHIIKIGMLSKCFEPFMVDIVNAEATTLQKYISKQIVEENFVACFDGTLVSSKPVLAFFKKVLERIGDVTRGTPYKRLCEVSRKSYADYIFEIQKKIKAEAILKHCQVINTADVMNKKMLELIECREGIVMSEDNEIVSIKEVIKELVNYVLNNVKKVLDNFTKVRWDIGADKVDDSEDFANKTNTVIGWNFQNIKGKILANLYLIVCYDFCVKLAQNLFFDVFFKVGKMSENGARKMQMIFSSIKTFALKLNDVNGERCKMSGPSKQMSEEDFITNGRNAFNDIENTLKVIQVEDKNVALSLYQQICPDKSESDFEKIWKRKESGGIIKGGMKYITSFVK
ncbi:hypothetical protein EIN_134220 [Entamoeba invadens IP1]|uniref:Vps53 N-terminal domain-containing protein n=1 Tax=Entamoeba invadens IP1 TaxID=370355 RepID=A0A0A1TX89_ENTIV|nr:hypothetical protein EIN_134220 [Entamoeba invadens IP1]ELP85888.1 hypothetical protein EIN_134220 [Entamoeba invadens IP1]|eukprot:XP_004185234.1 hypothetical protein EIN_134220 [Entamoeba invadens IP1]